MFTQYPTQKEIEQGINECPPSTTNTQLLFKWKEKHYIKQWKNKSNEEKLNDLKKLIQSYWEHNNYSGNIKITNNWSYNPGTHTIYADFEKPSIISALHELGHSLYGPSELTTCIFSIGLFQECFPIEFSRLEWDGHLLKRITR